jgi:hypothetical protein
MKHFTQFDTARTAAAAAHGFPPGRWAQTRQLIGTLRYNIALLEADIAAEQARCGIDDPSDIAYPPLAKSWFERCLKLKTTVASLEAYVGTAPDATQ